MPPGVDGGVMLFRAMMASAVLLCAGVAMAEDKAPEVAGAPPLAAFFDDPIYSSAALSPNGSTWPHILPRTSG